MNPEFKTKYMKTTISKHFIPARSPDPLACANKTKLILLVLLINNGYCFCTKSWEGGWGGGPNQTRNRRKGTESLISHDPPFIKKGIKNMKKNIVFSGLTNLKILY